jgi:hypothetical protein
MGKLIDLSGKRFGNWTVLERDLSTKRPVKYFCKCDCEEVFSIHSENLKRNLSKQCRKCVDLSRSKNLIGMRFGFVRVTSVEKHKNIAKAKITCDCGRERFISPGKLKSGIYKSCGLCNLNRKKKKHVNKYFNIGSKFGYLEIIERIDSKTMKARCECGNEKKVKIHHLQTKHPSCGCYWKNKRIEKAKRLVGIKIGYLKVLSFLGMTGKINKNRANYLLKCKCGVKFERSISYLFGSNSCGCLQKEKSPKGSINSNSILKEFEVTSMRELFKSGYYNKRELSKMFNISESTCGNIINKKTWKHID